MSRASTESSSLSDSPSSDLAALSYEQARDALIEVVTRLESGAGTLDESLALWERGEALAARCQEWLDGARERLEASRLATSAPSVAESPAATPTARS